MRFTGFIPKLRSIPFVASMIRVLVVLVSALAPAAAGGTICSELPCACADTCTQDDVSCTDKNGTKTPGCLCIGQLQFGGADCIGNYQGILISGTIPPGFAQALQGKLTHSLTIGNSHISGTLPDDFALLTALPTLAVFNNPISGTLPASLSSLEQLQYCDLSSNHPGWACPLPKLPAACQDTKCHTPPPATKYICHLTNYTCAPSSAGDFPSMAGCSAACVPDTYSCQITTSTRVESRGSQRGAQRGRECWMRIAHH